MTTPSPPARKFLALTPPLYDYVLAHSAAETDAQRRLRAETARHPRGGMQIAPDQGRFMAWLVRLTGARRALEIGVFTGYSALTVAQALPEDGRLVACDISAEFTDVGRPYWRDAGVDARIDLRLGPAIDTLDALLADGQADSFDFAFIDADKGNYDGYYERVLRLVRRGGVIAIDNVLWSGRVADPAATDADTAAIRALNSKVAADPRVDACLLTLADGLTLVHRLE